MSGLGYVLSGSARGTCGSCSGPRELVWMHSRSGVLGGVGEAPVLVPVRPFHGDSTLSDSAVSRVG